VKRAQEKSNIYSDSSRKPNVSARNASVKAGLCRVTDNFRGEITAEKQYNFTDGTNKIYST
jgi:hypothetical protein